MFKLYMCKYYYPILILGDNAEMVQSLLSNITGKEQTSRSQERTDYKYFIR